jgi:hypothetical protein
VSGRLKVLYRTGRYSFGDDTIQGTLEAAGDFIPMTDARIDQVNGVSALPICLVPVRMPGGEDRRDDIDKHKRRGIPVSGTTSGNERRFFGQDRFHGEDRSSHLQSQQNGHGTIDALSLQFPTFHYQAQTSRGEDRDGTEALKVEAFSGTGAA